MLGTDIRGIMAEEEEVQRRSDPEVAPFCTEQTVARIIGATDQTSQYQRGWCNSPVKNVRPCTSRKSPSQISTRAVTA
jgi:hypothetical protein